MYATIKRVYKRGVFKMFIVFIVCIILVQIVLEILLNKKVWPEYNLHRTIVYVLAALLLTACGKDGLKKLEYNIDGEWKHCSQVADAPCGLSLRCGDELYQCVNGVEIRAR